VKYNTPTGSDTDDKTLWSGVITSFVQLEAENHAIPICPVTSLNTVTDKNGRAVYQQYRLIQGKLEKC